MKLSILGKRNLKPRVDNCDSKKEIKKQKCIEMTPVKKLYNNQTVNKGVNPQNQGLTTFKNFNNSIL